MQLKRRLAGILFAAVLSWFLLATIPVAPSPIGSGVDASWQYGLNLAHQRGIPFGTGLVFTMGPFAYLMYPDGDLASGARVLTLLVSGYVLLVYGVARLAWRCGAGVGALAAFVFGIASLYWLQYPDAWQVSCLAVLLAAAAHRHRFPALDLTVAGLAAGFTLLLKFNDGVTLCAIFYVLAAWSWRRFRAHRAALFVACLPPAVLLAGMASQGPLAATLPYARFTFEIGRGYSEAMGSPGPVAQMLLAAATAVIILAVPVLFREPARVLPALAAAGLLAVTAFKHGMVRQDGHADVTQAKLAAAALFVFVASIRPNTRRWLATIAVASSIASVIIYRSDPKAFTAIADQRATLASLAPTVDALAHWPRTWARLGPENRPVLDALQVSREFSDAIGAGTVDAYPANIETVRANGWKYQPRPLFQSFTAYTPALDQLNAEHIRSPRTADFVLVQPGSIDGRHLFFDDPLSFRALLDRYRFRLADSRAILLERRTGPPLFREPEPMGVTIAAWNKETPIPRVEPGQALLMKADIRRTRLGSWRVAVLRGAPVQLQASRQNAGQIFARMVRGNLGSGVIISPLASDIGELTRFFTDRKDCPPVVSLYWWTPEPDEFEPAIRIEWFRLRPSLP
ncbi:MAG: hypothetical protein JSU00_26320 [Acidobacteria bacterium]|nr:hypothetical protein [Acidobacteriota bacterium]